MQWVWLQRAREVYRMMSGMNRAVLLVALLVPVTALAAWHANLQASAAAAGNAARRHLPGPPTPAQEGWLPAHPSHRWECIVIHHSATEIGGAERFDKAHREKGWDELGYHFVIGNGSDTSDGQVEVGPRWREQKHGAHCFTPDEYFNAHGIGICLVGNLDDHPPTPRQLRSLNKLVRYLCRAYDIPADHVYTHGDVTGKTRCPGAKFDLDALRASVR